MNTIRITNERMIAALKATDGMVYLAADRLGCDPQTIYNRRNKVKAVADVITNARERFIDTAESSLKRAVLKGEGWAVCFALKCQGKARGYVERAELTGKDGGPLEVHQTVDLSGLSDDELSTLETLAQRAREVARSGRDPVREGPPGGDEAAMEPATGAADGGLSLSGR